MAAAPTASSAPPKSSKTSIETPLHRQPSEQ
jgi:hypothetical protein